MSASIDSLLRILTHKDSLLASMRSRVDTLVVHDTTWAAHLERSVPFGGITVAHVVGWIITIGGFVVTGYFAVRGWRKAAETARKGWEAASRTAVEAQERKKAVDDAASREVFVDMLAESLWFYRSQIPTLLNLIENDTVIAANFFRHLDRARDCYDQNRERLVLITDSSIRRSVARWFIRERFWRTTLELHFGEGLDRKPPAADDKAALEAVMTDALQDAQTLWKSFKFDETYTV